MKETLKRKSVVFAIIFFVALNTFFLWERLPAGWDFLLILILWFSWLILVFLFLIKFGKLFIDRFKSSNDLISVIVIVFVLLFHLMFPLGFITSSDLDPKYYLIASREGAANCETTFILGINETFIERSVCFGVNRKSGVYKIKNDTVFLTFDEKSNFGIKETFGIIEWNKEKKRELWIF